MIACFLFPQTGIAVERTRIISLWGAPLALVSPEGVLLVVSDEGQQFGVRVGQSASSARALCSSLVVLPYDRAGYETAMQSVWNALAIESSVVEPTSPEIVFSELTGRDIIERVQNLSQNFSNSLRIPVQVGLAKSKFVAYQAALRSRETELVVVTPGTEALFLSAVPLHYAPQINPKLRLRLNRLGLHNFGDLSKLPARELQRQFRQDGLRLHRLARGEDGDRIQALWPPRSLCHSISFEDEVHDERTVHHALKLCAEEIACALIKNREYARSMELFVSLADGSQLQADAKLIMPLDDAAALHRVAIRLLRRLPIEQPLVGIRLEAGDLGAGSGIQMALFDDNGSGIGYPHERRRKLEEAIAYCKGRFGIGAVVPARLLAEARRIHLWTYPLGHIMNERVDVATTSKGVPVRYWRRGRRYEVKRIHDRWKEAEAVWNELVERTTFRVETEPTGLYELKLTGKQWRVVGVAD